MLCHLLIIPIYLVLLYLASHWNENPFFLPAFYYVFYVFLFYFIAAYRLLFFEQCRTLLFVYFTFINFNKLFHSYPMSNKYILPLVNLSLL